MISLTFFWLFIEIMKSNEDTYFIGPNRLNWNDAGLYCKNSNSILGKIRTLNDFNKLKNVTNNSLNYYWIGLKRKNYNTNLNEYNKWLWYDNINTFNDFGFINSQAIINNSIPWNNINLDKLNGYQFDCIQYYNQTYISAKCTNVNFPVCSRITSVSSSKYPSKAPSVLTKQPTRNPSEKPTKKPSKVPTNGPTTKKVWFIGPDNLEWLRGQFYCERNGGDLATIKNAAEYNILKSLTKYGEPVWIGLHSRNKKWEWVDNTPVKNTYGFYSDGTTKKNGQGWNTNKPQYLQRCVQYTNLGSGKLDGYDEEQCWGKFRKPFCKLREKETVRKQWFVGEYTTVFFYGKQYCENNGAKIATIKDMNEYNTMKSLVPIGISVWIGLTNHWRTGKDWKWSDGTPVANTPGFTSLGDIKDYEVWLPGEPNSQYDTSARAREECVEFRNNVGSVGYNDVLCNSWSVLRKPYCKLDTKSPTIQTILPTKSPTIKTRNPSKLTILPTSLPSKITSIPTLNPSTYPTNNPTNTPTNIPTLNPSTYPTNTPTIQPTIQPTIVTNTPTNNPTNTPSNIPTINPIQAPSNVPTLLPLKNENNNNNNNNNNKTENDNNNNSLAVGWIILIIIINNLLCCVGFGVYYYKREENFKKTINMTKITSNNVDSEKPINNEIEMNKNTTH